MANAKDIGKPGGWLVRVTTPGNPPLKRYFKAYEFDKEKAISLVKAQASVEAGETCEAVSQLNVHEFTGDNMQPGQVKQHG
jgi:hypothetical protein